MMYKLATAYAKNNETSSFISVSYKTADLYTIINVVPDSFVFV